MITCTFEDGGAACLRHATVDVIVLGAHDDVLLARRSQKVTSESGKLCLPGGYLDRDEDLQSGGKREVREETGYDVDIQTLFHIRDMPTDVNDNNRQNIVFTYHAKVVGHISNDRDWDSDEPIWVRLADIPQIQKQLAFDHGHVLMAYLDYTKGKYSSLPLYNAYHVYGQ